MGGMEARRKTSMVVFGRSGGGCGLVERTSESGVGGEGRRELHLVKKKGFYFVVQHAPKLSPLNFSFGRQLAHLEPPCSGMPSISSGHCAANS
eukprot:3481871-Rhodomonas_salina.1